MSNRLKSCNMAVIDSYIVAGHFPEQNLI
ncbi:hypothetical protein CXF93_09585 [Moritella sp. Urea-trap-13]|nr:hypothetical protein CXF93_09585 [Moritella sp. Urea-trap-13]